MENSEVFPSGSVAVAVMIGQEGAGKVVEKRISPELLVVTSRLPRKFCPSPWLPLSRAQLL